MNPAPRALFLLRVRLVAVVWFALGCTQTLDLSRRDAGGDRADVAADVVVCPSDVAPRVERCNGVDDDCDGEVDEGFAWSVQPSSSGTTISPGASLAAGMGFTSSRDGRMTFLWNEGVTGKDCRDILRWEFFDAYGLHQQSLDINSLPAVLDGVLWESASGARGAFRARDYAFRQCPRPGLGLCPLVLVDRPRRGNASVNYYAVGDCTTINTPVATDPGALAVSSATRPGPDPGTVRRDLYVIADDLSVSRREGALALPTLDRGDAGPSYYEVRGVRAGARVHWVALAADGAYFHVSTDLQGGDASAVHVGRIPLASARFSPIEQLTVGGGSIAAGIVDADDHLHIALLSTRDGALESSFPTGLSSRTQIALSPDGAQVYACSHELGVAFTRFSRAGSRLQTLTRPAINLGEMTYCHVTAVSSGALVVWANREGGYVEWARLGCASAAP